MAGNEPVMYHPLRCQFLIGNDPLSYKQSKLLLYQLFEHLDYETSSAPPTPSNSDSGSDGDEQPRRRPAVKPKAFSAKALDFDAANRLNLPIDFTPVF